ncbi:kinase-like protein [Bimuria novae-zelandiae CBS 107.79]|uniref:Kinase-like protein n=1 Tax=Bimuria novae-zelandiae CBS 107.79 TaxID=1447943 RepID=A0A6A5ULD3_9PLEO|nr:kinase-like protein [Bimuria novae-zelandiae CBS 107.79]
MDDEYDKEYVFVEKRRVEINALADEIVRDPQMMKDFNVTKVARQPKILPPAHARRSSRGYSKGTRKDDAGLAAGSFTKYAETRRKRAGTGEQNKSLEVESVSQKGVFLLASLPESTEQQDESKDQSEHGSDSPLLLNLNGRPSMTTIPVWAVLLESLGLEHPETLAAFETNGVTNAWFPFPRQTLKRLLEGHSIDSDFFRRQMKGLFPKWPDDASKDHYYHLALEDGDETMNPMRVLGEGGHGLVEEVKLSNGVVCVRKRISRPKTLKAQKVLFEAFAREVKVMSQVKNRHCVQLVGSYTDLDSVAILSLPVADMDLAALLETQVAPHSRAWNNLQRGIGCLCNALAYLHRNKIRHEDLKPQNVLLHGDNLLLTDFGFSLDFSDECVSTTTGRPSAWTVRYAAPEVLNFEPRNRATDMYSLGCIIIEMVSSLHRQRLQDIKTFWRSQGNGHISFALNENATRTWCAKIARESFESDILMGLCDTLLADKRLFRPTAEQVIDRLLDLDLVHGHKDAAQNPIRLWSCCMRSINNTSVRHKLSEATLGYLHPTLYDNFEYFLLDIDLKMIYSKSAGFTDQELDLLDQPDKNITSLGTWDPRDMDWASQALKYVAYGRTTIFKLWDGRIERAIRSFPDGVAHAVQSVSIVPIKHMITIQIRSQLNPALLPSPYGHTIQISILPVCLERFESFRCPFFMVSFRPDELPRTEPPEGLFNDGKVMDFTRDS